LLRFRAIERKAPHDTLQVNIGTHVRRRTRKCDIFTEKKRLGLNGTFSTIRAIHRALKENVAVLAELEINETAKLLYCTF